MIGDFLKSFFANKKLSEKFDNLSPRAISFVLKEFVVVDLVCENGTSYTSKQIQDAYLEILEGKTTDYLHAESKSAKGKTNLKVMLGNILNSNSRNGNGLMNRPELCIFQQDKRYFFKASEQVLNDISYLQKNESTNLFDMGYFLSKYPYIQNLVTLLGLQTDFCQKNSNHIHNKGIMPVFVNNQKKATILNIKFVCADCVRDFAKSCFSK